MDVQSDSDSAQAPRLQIHPKGARPFVGKPLPRCHAPLRTAVEELPAFLRAQAVASPEPVEQRSCE